MRRYSTPTARISVSSGGTKSPIKAGANPATTAELTTQKASAVTVPERMPRRMRPVSPAP